MTSWQLRSALTVNALFSASSGVLMLLQPGAVADVLGVSVRWPILAIGIGLVVFAADLLHQAMQPRMAAWRAMLASAADMLWVLASAALLAGFPAVLSPTGHALVAVVAVIVFVLGIWQVWGVRNLQRLPDSGLYRHCIAVHVDAPAEAMWRVVSQLDEIARYTPALSRSFLADDQGPRVGAIRTCENHQGQQWSEQCIRFEPGRGLTVRFDAQRDDFPFPVSEMIGGWEVMPAGQGCEINVWWEFAPRPKPLGPLVAAALGWQADRTVPGMVRRMAEDAVGVADARSPRRTGPVDTLRARLLPKFC